VTATAEAFVVSRYTRAEAIDDGLLVDLMQGDLEAVVRGSFRFPMACTSAVFLSCIALTPAAEKAGCDIVGRLSDILWMARNSVSHRSGSVSLFQAYVVRDRRRPTLTTLKMVVGPGDDGEPVLTLMFPDED